MRGAKNYRRRPSTTNEIDYTRLQLSDETQHPTWALDYGKGNGRGEIVDAAFAAAAVALLGLLLSEPVSLVLTCQTSAVMRVSRQIYIVGIK